MIAELDGSLIHNKAELHEQLYRRLELPDHYGRNLDALFDVLTERKQPLELTVTGWQELESALGMYAAALMDTFFDAAAENANLKIFVK